MKAVGYQQSLPIDQAESLQDIELPLPPLRGHDVIDHSKSLSEEIAAQNLGPIDFIASLTNTHVHWPAICDVVKPQGRIGLIDDPPTLDVMPLKRKCVSLHWEFMFARPVFNTPDLSEQHHLLNEVSRRIGTGELKSTTGEGFGQINAMPLRPAHAFLESGKAKDKVVLAEF